MYQTTLTQDSVCDISIALPLIFSGAKGTKRDTATGACKKFFYWGGTFPFDPDFTSICCKAVVTFSKKQYGLRLNLSSPFPPPLLEVLPLAFPLGVAGEKALYLYSLKLKWFVFYIIIMLHLNLSQWHFSG